MFRERIYARREKGRLETVRAGQIGRVLNLSAIGFALTHHLLSLNTSLKEA